MLTPKKWEVIADRYHLERELARGGMGSVWEGHDKKLRRRVAVKLLAAELTDSKDARERFEREATAVAQLASPHVVQVFDYGVERGCPYIVMELLEGEDLRTRLHEVKRVTLEAAARILVQTSKALSIAHAAGVVHRDLKPGNVFIVKQGEEELVKVLDFGVAKVQLDDLLSAGVVVESTVMGTPQFMSPEQARGLADVDHRTDLWSLGVIIYRALTGKLPFHAAVPSDVIVKVCTEEPRPVSAVAPDLPRELDAFFERALAKDRAHRFESARQMAMAFSRISPVNFTTLSMPDPGPIIDEAIARARQDAREEEDVDDQAATMAIDPEGLDYDDLTDTTASAVPPPPRSSARLRMPPPLPPPPRTSPPARAVPPPPRTSPPASAVPPPPATMRGGPPPVPRRLAPPPGSKPAVLPPPCRAAGLAIPPPVPIPAAPSSEEGGDDLPTRVVDPTEVLDDVIDTAPRPAPSAPVLLRAEGASQESDPELEPRTPQSLFPASVLGSDLHAPRDGRGMRPTLLMALGAVVAGVLVALVASALVGRGSPSGDAVVAAPAEASPAAEDAREPAELEEVEPKATAAAPAETAEQQDAPSPEKPRAKKAVRRTSSPPRSARPAPRPAEPPPPAAPAETAPAAPEAPPPPKPEPPPSSESDPFADRL